MNNKATLWWYTDSDKKSSVIAGHSNFSKIGAHKKDCYSSTISHIGIYYNRVSDGEVMLGTVGLSRFEEAQMTNITNMNNILSKIGDL